VFHGTAPTDKGGGCQQLWDLDVRSDDTHATAASHHRHQRNGLFVPKNNTWSAILPQSTFPLACHITRRKGPTLAPLLPARRQNSWQKHVHRGCDHEITLWESRSPAHERAAREHKQCCASTKSLFDAFRPAQLSADALTSDQKATPPLLLLTQSTKDIWPIQFRMFHTKRLCV